MAADCLIVEQCRKCTTEEAATESGCAETGYIQVATCTEMGDEVSPLPAEGGGSLSRHQVKDSCPALPDHSAVNRVLQFEVSVSQPRSNWISEPVLVLLTFVV